MKNSDLLQLISDDARTYDAILGLRGAFSTSRFDDVRAPTREAAIRRGIEVIHAALAAYGGLGIKVETMDPGHGVGHLARDYVNGLLLAQNVNASPQHLFVGLIGGVLHDFGNAVVFRYEEGKRVARHAEAGAVLFNEMTKGLDINEAERTLIAHSIAGHTHYLAPLTVNSADGIERTLQPYQDKDSQGQPLMGMWLPRWIDRLDCNGPTFPGRHYLTLTSPRPEFDGEKFYQSSLVSALSPSLRGLAEIKTPGAPVRSMREHLRMFARSQSNNSAYGQYDDEAMREMRDAHTTIINAIVGAVDSDASLTSADITSSMNRWTTFMHRNVEPSVLGRNAAHRLREMVDTLDDTSRKAWASGFDQAMHSYVPWAREKLARIEELSLPDKDHVLPLVNLDIRDVLEPHF